MDREESSRTSSIAWLVRRWSRPALSKGPATASELVPLIYERLSPALTRAAASSVWAHLRRMHELGRARCDDPDDLGARWEAL